LSKYQLALDHFPSMGRILLAHRAWVPLALPVLFCGVTDQDADRQFVDKQKIHEWS
jgi:hypothetical protein